MPGSIAAPRLTDMHCLFKFTHRFAVDRGTHEKSGRTLRQLLRHFSTAGIRCATIPFRAQGRESDTCARSCCVNCRSGSAAALGATFDSLELAASFVPPLDGSECGPEQEAKSRQLWSANLSICASPLGSTSRPYPKTDFLKALTCSRRRDNGSPWASCCRRSCISNQSSRCRKRRTTSHLCRSSSSRPNTRCLMLELLGPGSWTAGPSRRLLV